MNKTKDLLKSLKEKVSKIITLSPIEVGIDVLDNITSNQWYRYEDIVPIAMSLCRKYEYDEGSQFCVIGSIDELNKCLENGGENNFSKQPIFFIYNKGNDHWITFCITELDDRIKLLYKDSLCDSVPSEIHIKMKKKFKKRIEFLCHGKGNCRDQEDGHSCGPMSLRNMEIMMEGLKKDKENFISKFADIQFCKQRDVSSIKTNLKLALVEPFIEKELNGFNPDGEFKEELKRMIDVALKTSQLSNPVAHYMNVIKEENERKEKNPGYKIDHERIQESKADIDRNLKVLGNNMKEMEETLKDLIPKCKENKDSQSEIEAKHIEEMSGNDNKNNSKKSLEKLTKILDLLKDTEDTKEFKLLLDRIGTKFGLEGETLQQFFKIKKKEETERAIEDANTIKVEDVNDLIKRLPEKNIISSKKKLTRKPLEQLLAEMSFGEENELTRDSKNEDLCNKSSEEQRRYWKAKYQNDPEKVELESKFAKVQECKEFWKDKDLFAIRQWADAHKGKLAISDELEAIAIMDRANEMVTGGHQLRDTQILSVLTFLSTKPTHGKLCQINTGEGKTLITSILAAIRVLIGEQVDIITSNQVLAKEGVNTRGMFYSAFGITLATNNMEDDMSQFCERKCYKANIVYGTIANFQFDYLRDSFEKCGTRAGRKFGCAILDEVDNMTIDNGSYIAKLAGPFPGMDSLKYVYIKIWVELSKAEEEIFKEKRHLYKIKAEAWRNAKELSEEELQSELESFKLELIEKTTDELKEKIKKSEPAKIELIPVHLRQYAEDMTDKWIENAIYAKYIGKENEQYVIKQKKGEDVIVPVDYQNTGVTLKDTVWSDGLHQFVQLKHNLCVTSETLTTCFISNIGYIKLYDNKIFGLTGTLGSTAEQELLSKVYNIDYAKIPTYREKNFQEKEGIVVEDDQWIDFIAFDSVEMAAQGRSVLIICQTIKVLLDLEETIKHITFKEDYDMLKIKTYPDEDSSHVVEVRIETCEIIIATNIAGRGTDFKTSEELDNNGGLHVCVSFLPYNRRVEDQAFGRTSRQGNQGTAQLILKKSDLLEIGVEIITEMSFSSVKGKRDMLEKLRLEDIKNEKLMEIDFQDKIFSKFSDLYTNFKQMQKAIPGALHLVEDLKEYWAFWLHKKNFKGKDMARKDINTEFEMFKKDAKNILDGKEITHNPYHSVRQAEHFLKDNKMDKAEEALNHAICLSKGNSELLYSAYMKLFEVAIEKGGNMLKKFKKAVASLFFVNVEKDDQYKINARDALVKAKAALEKELDYISLYFFDGNSLSNYSIEGEGNEPSNRIDFQNILIKSENNFLLKHIKSRFVTLNIFHQHAESLIKQIDDNQDDGEKGICINTRIPNYLKTLDPNKESEKDLKEAITETELSELGSVGLDTLYSLKEVHDVPSEITIPAGIQIAAGFAALALGTALPMCMIVMAPIASTLITEGICDIVLELMSQDNSGFDKAAYIKGKCISYGISLLTMGIEVIAKSTAMLNQAIKACKGLSDILRRCPVLRDVCVKLADCLDKLANYIERVKCIAEMNRLKALKNVPLSRTQALTEGLKVVGNDLIKGIAETINFKDVVKQDLDDVTTPEASK